jgi:hypothetical protein
MTGQITQSYLLELLATTRGKIVTMLVIAALVLGIVAEGFSLYNSYLQIQINKAELRIKEAEAPLAEARSRAGMSNPIPERETKRKATCAKPEWKDSKYCEGVLQD